MNVPSLMDEVQNTGHSKAKHPIHNNEKQARKQDHENNEHGGNQSFAARRPSHLARLGANLLQEFQGVSHCLDVTQQLDVASAGRASQFALPVNHQVETALIFEKRGYQKIRARNPEATRQDLVL
jgi:hypothetical protein